MEQKIHNKERILWMDIAKAIAIFAMIQGHTTPYGSSMRNFIYTFHMPLFFILTGYTMRPVNNFKEFWQAELRDFKKLYLPYLGIQTLNGILSYFIYNENMMDSIKLRLVQLFWGSAIDVYGHSCVGMIWFLVALFWSKMLYRLVWLLLKSEYTGIIFFMLALLGKMFSASGIYLPQSIDVCFVAVLFIYLGYEFKNCQDFYKKYQKIICVIAFGIWMWCWDKGIYIELGGRWYPDFTFGILGACCGSICIFTLSQALEKCGIITKVLCFIGRNTFTILCVSFIDWIAINFWAAHGLTFAYIARPAYVLLVSVVVVYCKLGITKLFDKKTTKHV